MKFERITMENFRVYKGKTVLDFSLPVGRNIYLIDGNNGYGKTTIQVAVRYCLYGVEQSTQERHDFINHRAMHEGNAHMMAQIQLEHNKKTYLVTRSVDSDDKGRTDEKFTVMIDGVISKAPDAVVNDILPRDASQFFFFDGEDIKRYTELDNPGETRKAIELVLGIPAIRNAVSHIDDLGKIVERKINEESKRDKDSEEIAKKVQDGSDQVKTYKDNLTKLEEDKAKLTEALESVEKDLLKVDAAKETLDMITSNAGSIKRSEERIREIGELEMDALTRLPFLIVARDLRAKLNSESERVGKARDSLRDRAKLEGAVMILQSLKTGDDCYCGSKIGEAEKIFLQQHISRYSEKLAEMSGSSDFDMLSLQKLERAVGKLDAFKFDLAQHIKSKRAEIETIDDLVAQNKKLEEKLKGISTEDIKKLTKNRDRLKEQITKVKSDIEWTEGGRDRAQSILDKDKRDLERVSPVTPQKKKLQTEQDLIERCGKALREYLEVTVEEKRVRIEKETSGVHKKLTNKPEVYASVKIRDDYTFAILDRDKNEVSNDKISAGEKEILALSFIAGLNRSTDKEAPVIMDTPFARLDQEHKSNVLKFLSNLGSQVVILATDLDINKDNIGEIQSHVGKRSRIVFDVTTMSSAIKEES